MVTAAANVAQSHRRNRNTVVTISPRLITRQSSISRTLARIVSVRSLITDRSTAGGSHACSVGTSAWIRSTVSITLALTSLKTKTSTAGCLLNHPEVRTFSTLSTTDATASSRIGVPWRVATITDLYSSALRN